MDRVSCPIRAQLAPPPPIPPKRYNLDPFKSHRMSAPDESQDVLGPEQWAWLENELVAAKGTTDLVVIGSGVQVGG